MSEEAKEQLLFEQYIRGLPRPMYENIRLSPDIKTSESVMKRVQVLIRMQGETGCSEGAAASVTNAAGYDTTKSPRSEIQQLNEAVKRLTERLNDLGEGEDEKTICALEGCGKSWRMDSRRRPEGNKVTKRGYERTYPNRGSYQRTIKCFVCGGEGHVAKECANTLRMRCYNCGQMGHTMRNCPKSRRGSPGESRRNPRFRNDDSISTL